jgi:hypothetical protein
MLGGLQSRCRQFREREKILAFVGIQIYPGKRAKGGNMKKLLITSLLPVSA